MMITATRITSSRLFGLTWAVALIMPVDMGAPAMACDSDKATAEDAVVRLVGDRQVETELNERLAQLEFRLQNLQRNLDELSETLAGMHGNHDGRSGAAFFVTPPQRKGTLPTLRTMPTMPSMPAMPSWAASVPPTPSAPPAPPAPPGYRSGGDSHGYEAALERFHEAQERWQERHHDWQERQADRLEQWRELQSDAMERWHDQMEDWREYQHEATEQWREKLHGLREHGDEWSERLSEVEVPRTLDAAKDLLGELYLIDAGEGNSNRIVYDVTAKQADLLYKLLAPSDVKPFVSWSGQNIAVSGTKHDHAAIDAGLQLLGWIDRDEVFEEMIQGERHSRTYELGEKRAELLYKMLAPSTVQVFVSPAGDEAVSISATNREHEVLNDFLDVLSWMH